MKSARKSAHAPLLAMLTCSALMPMVVLAQSTSKPDQQSSWRLEGGGGLGYVSYDLTTNQGNLMGGGQFGFRLAQVLLLEPGVAFFWAEFLPERVTPYVTVDLTAVADVDRWRLSPIAGVGSGISFGGEDLPHGLGLQALAGARYRVSSQWALRLDLKARSIDGGRGSTFEVTIGVRKRHR